MKEQFSREDFEFLLINLKKFLVDEYSSRNAIGNKYVILLDKILFEHYLRMSNEEFESIIDQYDFETEEGMKSFAKLLHNQVR